MSKNQVIEEFRMNFDDGDAWGSTIGFHFAIADYLQNNAPELIPEEWEYRAGASTDTEDFHYTQLEELTEAGVATIEDIVHAGKVLHRYSAQLELAGLDY